MAVAMRTDRVATAYDRWAPAYDLFFGRVFRQGRSDAIMAAERIGGEVLEVGVGTGLSLPQYSSAVRLTGVDISDGMLAKAQERVRAHGLSNVAALRVMDAEALEFDDNSFDVVVAQYVVTAVPDPERALDEFARVVRPGGEIVITTRVGADTGVRRHVERVLMPLTSRLGFRTEFRWRRYLDWLATQQSIRLVERRPLPPLGHFSLVRFVKQDG
ncbi:class I SAM-dependent methyltransferase [Sphingomonas quercus]|uniref:Methyltransferase domain-containing protein n=1 Tax=Sphingomonas quercus TaxID=2842451 RepID=A0ABS6BPL7_9SPHN|nr:methyltransferase domain-containing protein [Sphingomonas quercus]MBU3079209.1 methyltransferase domain-containing protein [Sphingomonas quercus]